MFTAPDEFRAKLSGLTAIQLVNEAAKLRPRADGDVVVHGIKTAAAILARRVQALDAELDAIDVQLAPLVKAAAPGMLQIFGVGVDTAAMLIVAAGDNPERIVSESAWAMICGVAPIPVMSRQDQRSLPAQPRRQPASKQRAVADRDHPPRSARTSHHGLHEPSLRRGQIEAGDHPLPQALRRSRNLPGAPALTRTRRRDWPDNCLTPIVVVLQIDMPSRHRTPSPDRGLIRACPHQSGPSLVCPNTGNNQLDKHRSVDR